jgi:putative component of membrane protein insertase Oxa1/YidC/SpoIIIJ protein YidD
LERVGRGPHLQAEAIPGTTARLLMTIVGAYQRSAWRRRLHRDGPRCGFIPSCSDYAMRALARHGAARGLVLTVQRLRKCRPGYAGPRVDFP